MRVLWISDGKPGHENQVLGLLERMGEITDLSIKKIAPVPLFWGIRDALSADAPTYDFVIAAGRRTHTSLWWLGYLYRIPRVVVMRPSGLGHGASLRIIPEHDGVQGNDYTHRTRGPMNRVRASDNPSDHPVAVIGGISKHFQWDDESIYQQLMTWLDAHPTARVLDSRRTPTLLSSQLQTQLGDQFIHWKDSQTGQLASLMAEASAIWVTPDSASMVFEAWSTNAQVTLAQLPANNTRVARAVIQGEPDMRPLNEAHRAAVWLLSKL